VNHDAPAPLFSPATTLKGVGPAVGALLAKAVRGERVIDLLFHLPFHPP
jgi:ATP-dependent DNA helicase RecG